MSHRAIDRETAVRTQPAVAERAIRDEGRDEPIHPALHLLTLVVTLASIWALFQLLSAAVSVLEIPDAVVLLRGLGVPETVLFP